MTQGALGGCGGGWNMNITGAVRACEAVGRGAKVNAAVITRCRRSA